MLFGQKLGPFGHPAVFNGPGFLRGLHSIWRLLVKSGFSLHRSCQTAWFCAGNTKIVHHCARWFKDYIWFHGHLPWFFWTTCMAFRAIPLYGLSFRALSLCNWYTYPPDVDIKRIGKRLANGQIWSLSTICEYMWAIVQQIYSICTNLQFRGRNESQIFGVASFELRSFFPSQQMMIAIWTIPFFMCRSFTLFGSFEATIEHPSDILASIFKTNLNDAIGKAMKAPL